MLQKALRTTKLHDSSQAELMVHSHDQLICTSGVQNFLSGGQIWRSGSAVSCFSLHHLFKSITKKLTKLKTSQRPLKTSLHFLLRYVSRLISGSAFLSTTCKKIKNKSKAEQSLCFCCGWGVNRRGQPLTGWLSPSWLDVCAANVY